MPSTFSLLLNGTPADDKLITSLSMLEIEEHAELPGAISLRLPIDTTDTGDLTYVSDSRFAPLANLAVVVDPDGSSPQCIFDGYVLSHKIHLETGTTQSTLQVWGQDASWLMNLEEKAREWVDVTDADVANTLFGDYGINPASDNTDDDSPSHTEDGHSLMQRATDIQFLRTLAQAQWQTLPHRMRRSARRADRLFLQAQARWRSRRNPQSQRSYVMERRRARYRMGSYSSHCRIREPGAVHR